MTKYHLIGIGGIGMSALAHLLLDKQQSVSGSDLVDNRQTTALKEKGAEITCGHHPKHIKAHSTVVYSSAVKETNPEYRQALDLQCRMIHRSELLAELMKGYINLAVSGSHGKTTTTSLLAHVFIHAGYDPSYALGGLFEGCNGRVGKGEHFIFEADESDGTFEAYRPDYAIVTNIDHEHLEHYGDFETLQASCTRFCDQVKQTVVYCKDDPYLHCRGISYGFSAGSDVRVTNVVQTGFEQKVTLSLGKQEYTYRLPLIGKHNALNSAAVFALAHHIGIDPAVIMAGLTTFPGVGRRMERRGDHEAILQLDDYAHHPTEVMTTLEGVKKAVGERRLIVLFQPHRFTRTRDHFEEFTRAFEHADLVYMTDIYAAGEEPIEGISTQALVERMREHSSVPCHYLPRERWTDLNEVLRPHDVFVSMGAGDVTCVHHGLTPKKKLRVGVVYGGRSCEHEISCRSSQFVSAVLNSKIYDVERLFIDKEGLWHVHEDEEGHSPLHPKIAKKISHCDLIFPVLHGPFGEDGTIQGFFEMADIPYVGCDWSAAAISMNKYQSKLIAASQGVFTPKGFAFTQREWQSDRMTWLAEAQRLHFPLYVKPNHLGSSVGISKVLTEDRLVEAIELAFSVDTEVLIEEGIENGRELEFAVMGNHDGFEIQVPGPGEKLAGGRFVDYTLKYTPPGVPTTVEPELSAELLQAGKEAAWKVYRAIGCSGMTRVDFLLDRDGKWWFFELNPIPGMQPLSLFPKIWKREGVEPSALMDRLVVLALDRAQRRKRYFIPL